MNRLVAERRRIPLPIATHRLAARTLLAVVAALLLVPIDSAWPQAGGRLSPVQAFNAMKPGQWIRIDGVARNDQTVMSNQVKLLTGQIKETAWSIRGPLREIDATKRTLKVGGYRIRLAEQLKFGSVRGTLHDLGGLRVGMLVKVEGTYEKDSGFLAVKVDDESDQLARKPGIEKRIRVQGKIERVDPANRSVTVMGTTCVVTNHTLVMSVAK